MVRLLLTVALLTAGGARANECDPGSLDIRQGASAAKFSIEVVDTPAERSVGLMNRESLPQFAGMLFVYEAPQPVAFWMRNTLIPLDMLFADDRGVVTRIHRNARPLDETAIPGGDAIRYVLEINGGLSAELGLTEGAEIRHPAIDPSRAAWPCADG